MTIEGAVLSFAGFVVLAGVALGWWVSPWWFLLTALAGPSVMYAAKALEAFDQFAPLLQTT